MAFCRDRWLNFDRRFSSRSRSGDYHVESPPHSPDWSCDAAVRRRSAARVFAAQAAREGSLQRGRALDAVRAGLRRASTKGYFEEPASTSRWRRRRAATSRWRRCCPTSADIALIGPEIGDLRAEQRFADQDPDLLRAHLDRRLHAGRPREGRQVRLEHAQGQGDPRLPAGQHAAAVSRSGAAPERDRSAKGRQAHQQRRASRRASAPGSRARTSTPSSSSRMPRSSSSTARRTSSPRSARPWVPPTTPPSWRPTNTSARTTRRSRTGPTRSPRRMKWTAEAPVPELVKTLEQFFPGVEPEGDGGVRRTLPQAQDLEDLAGDRAGADGEIPGHSGAGPRARAGQAREVPGPGASPSSPTRRSDPWRHRRAAASPKVELRDVNLRYFGLEGETEALKGISICGRARRVRRHHRPERLRQEHAAVADLRHPHADRRRRAGRRQAGRPGRAARSATCCSRTICSSGGPSSKTRCSAPKSRAPTWPRRASAPPALLTRYGLGQFLHHLPRQLSGGMRQRVGAGAHAVHRAGRRAARRAVLGARFTDAAGAGRRGTGILRREGKTAILVTHDIGEAVSMAERVIVLSRRPGRVKSDHAIRFATAGRGAPGPVRRAQRAGVQRLFQRALAGARSPCRRLKPPVAAYAEPAISRRGCAANGAAI